MAQDAVVLYGAPFSVYVRIARLALEEKGVPYDLEPVDIFAEEGPPPGYLARHPFGRIPAFQHGTFQLYEAAAIARYVDEAFDGPALQPEAPPARARMNQIIGILDSYAYRTLVWDIYVAKRESGEEPSTETLARGKTCLTALQDLKGEQPWLAGEQLSLADLHAAPIMVYALMTPEGQTLLEDHSSLAAWWHVLARRDSLARTRFPAEDGHDH
ncbi:MAG: glutathione S-transferase family protein [Pseudomonadota bacterium]